MSACSVCGESAGMSPDLLVECSDTVFCKSRTVSGDKVYGLAMADDGVVKVSASCGLLPSVAGTCEADG